MPFFPDSIYGLVYLGALIFFGAITWFGPNKSARRLLLILTIHWLTTRTIDFIDHTNFLLWIVQDIAMIVALLIFCKGMAGRAIAGLFFIVLTFDNYSLVTGGTFEGAAAVAEFIGYISMVIMAGAGHGNSGKLARYSGDIRAGIGSVLYTGKSWLSLKRRS
jgi:hypothetical protein